MNRQGNTIAHTDFEPGSPRRLRHNGRLSNRTDPVEINSFYSAVNSIKSPSIIGLENLHMHGNESYTVEEMSEALPPVPNKKSKTKSPMQAFQPLKHSQEGRELTKVYLNVVILKVGQIETIKEYFEADVYIQAKWREPVLDRTRTKVSDFSSFWNPELVIQNCYEEPKEKIWHEVRYTDKGEAFIYEMRRVKGKFFETMELNEFPFDVQSISLVLSTELTKDVVNMVEDKTEISNIHVDCFSDSQEWQLHDFVEIDPMDISAQFTRAGKNYSGLIATCCVSRRSGFFAWNVIVIVNMLNIFAFTTFAVSPSLPQNRLQLSFILILAGISFRFVTNQSIPKISYLTHLDRYILISMVFSGCITFWHALLSRFNYDSDLQDRMDFWAFILFAVAYFVFQLVFIFVMYWQRRQKLQEIRGKEDKYKGKAKSIMGDLWGVIRDEIGSATTHITLRRRSDIHRRPR